MIAAAPAAQATTRLPGGPASTRLGQADNNQGRRRCLTRSAAKMVAVDADQQHGTGSQAQIAPDLAFQQSRRDGGQQSPVSSQRAMRHMTTTPARKGNPPSATSKTATGASTAALNTRSFMRCYNRPYLRLRPANVFTACVRSSGPKSGQHFGLE